MGKKQKKGMTKNDERLQILAHTEKIQNLSLRWRVRALRERIQTETKGGTAVRNSTRHFASAYVTLQTIALPTSRADLRNTIIGLRKHSATSNSLTMK